jgi:peptide/nickel transport system permease protein
MLLYVLRRLGFLILTLLLTSMIIFAITQFLPGDVCRVILGREPGEAALVNCRARLNLDDPTPVRYLRWLGDFVSGDWGDSFSTGDPIRSMVMARVRNTLMLSAVVLVMALPVALALGVIAGTNENKPVDTTINLSSLALVGMPEFVTGVVLVQLLSFELNRLLYPLLGIRLFPASSSIGLYTPFWEALPSLILPALTAAIVLAVYVVRITRAGVIEELRQPYVRTATLKGLPRRTVMVKHVLRNALLPTVTVIAISLGWLISGLIVIENVFNYPGLGRLMVYAIDRRDLPLIQAIAMVTVTGFGIANLAADLLYAVLNPRIRLGG